MPMSNQQGKLRKRVGIGTAVAACSALMVGAVGAILSIPTPPPTGSGQVRSYASVPDVAWTVDRDNLPSYGQGDGITVAGVWMDRWLLSYPSGLGKAYVMVSAASGKPVWSNPITVGLGSCALNNDGAIGCAVKLGSVDNGFYLADLNTGTLSKPTPLDDTAQVIGVGKNFLRIDEAGYLVTMTAPDGTERWTRTFASATKARYVNKTLVLTGSDGSNVVVDAATGDGLIRCSDCEIRTYPTGITVSHNGFGKEGVDFYGTKGDELTSADPTHRATGFDVVRGSSTLPVLNPVGASTIAQTQGRFEIRDPARTEALWSITDPELSKANARPCGSVVSFARKDRSRAIFRLADGMRLGDFPTPNVNEPDANIDQLTCVGSSKSTILFANGNQLTGFQISDGKRWELPIIGTAEAVDGYVVLHQGQSMTVLKPS